MKEWWQDRLINAIVRAWLVVQFWAELWRRAKRAWRA